MCISGNCPGVSNAPSIVCVGNSTEYEDCDHANKGRLYIHWIHIHVRYIAGILVTYNNLAWIFIPSTKEWLPLPSIPGSPRQWHTLTRNVICGGVWNGTSTSCVELLEKGGGWKEYPTTLSNSRAAHSSYDSPDGVVLIGGYYSSDTFDSLENIRPNSRFGSDVR